MFILPALAIYALFVLTPIVGSARMSLFEWGGSPLPRFVAFKNYALLLKDTIFWRALMNNTLVLVGSLVIQLPFSALLALFLSYKTFCRTLFRTAFFAPMVMPTVAIAILWQYIYAPEDGLVTKLIQLVCNNDFTFPWLAMPSSSPFLPSVSLLCIFVTICWQYTGFHMVLYMAGIAAIPDELYEAARIDGANEAQLFLWIGLPLGFPGLLSAMVLGFLESWGMIEQPMTFLRSQNLWPLALYLPQITDNSLSRALTASALTLIPPLMVFLCGQPYVQQGIGAMGMKE